MQLASNRLYLEPEKREEAAIVLEALAIAAHDLAAAEAPIVAVRRPRLTVTRARRFISRNMYGLRLDMPNIGDLKCRLLVTPSSGGSKVLVIDPDLYRGDISLLITKAIQTLPEVLHKRPTAFF